MSLSVSAPARPLFFYISLSVFGLLAVTSVTPHLTHLFYTTWLSRRWSLNPIFSLSLVSSLHLTIHWPLEPQKKRITTVRGEKSMAGVPQPHMHTVVLAPHLYTPPRALVKFSASWSIWGAIYVAVYTHTIVCNAVVYRSTVTADGLLI